MPTQNCWVDKCYSRRWSVGGVFGTYVGVPKGASSPSDDQYGIWEVVSFCLSHWLFQVSEQRGRWRQSGNMGLRADRLQSESLLPGQSSLMFQRLRKSNLSLLAFKVKSRNIQMNILHPCFVVHSITLSVYVSVFRSKGCPAFYRQIPTVFWMEMTIPPAHAHRAPNWDAPGSGTSAGEQAGGINAGKFSLWNYTKEEWRHNGGNLIKTDQTPKTNVNNVFVLNFHLQAF